MGYHLLVIGEGPMRAQLERQVRDARLEEHVTLSSYRQDWWGLLKVAAGVISASRYEGQPNVVLETIAAGCPLIVSDIPEHREFLDEQCALWVPPENPTELAAAVAGLLADPESARERADRAVQRIAGLTVEASATAYDSIYQQLLAGRMPKCVES